MVFHAYPLDGVYHQHMARVAPRVPELAEILCSKCGYVLDGLPASGRCPECGTPIIDSMGIERMPPAWEKAEPGKKIVAFASTTVEVIRRPTQFYRTFTARGPIKSARKFAQWHWWFASGLFALAGATHGVWYTYYAAPSATTFPGGEPAMFASLVIGLTIGSYLCLDGITRLAAWLTNWEGTYRGYRLPYEIVLRGMYYHAAHYVPVAAAAAITVIGYQVVLAAIVHSRLKDSWIDYNSPSIYLYGLSAQVVVCAFYLFRTYWVGMRNMMFANR